MGLLVHGWSSDLAGVGVRPSNLNVLRLSGRLRVCLRGHREKLHF